MTRGPEAWQIPTRTALLVLLSFTSAGCAGAAGPIGRTDPPAATGTVVATPAGSTCNLVTPAEMSDIWDVQMRAAPEPDNVCTWSASTGLPSFSTRYEPTNLDNAKRLLGNDADVTISGNPGVIGNLFGVILYVRHGAVDLVVQTVELDDTPENRQKVIETAEKALTRVR